MDRIAAERPAIVIVANTRGAILVVDGEPIWSSGREDLWTAGVERSPHVDPGARRRCRPPR